MMKRMIRNSGLMVLGWVWLLGLAFQPLSAAEATKKDDAFEDGMRQAFIDYQKGNHEAVTAKLRELLKMMEEKGAAKVVEVLPEELGDWEGEEVKREELGAVGGGISVSRTYKREKEVITVKVVKDSPLVKQLIPLMANEQLVKLSGRKTQRISGETAIMENERKLQMVVDGRILLEATGNAEAGEKELVGLVRKLDLKALKKMK